MRTLLHAPRSRTRSIAAATLGALALVGSLLVATPAQAHGISHVKVHFKGILSFASAKK